jgi:type II secretory pathway component PulF
MQPILKMNKNGQLMNVLVGLGIGIVVLAIVIMTGLVVIPEFAQTIGTAEVNTTSTFLITELGSTGLAGWIPAVIALAVGLMFIGLFLGRKFAGRGV